jgi:small-conductance mechanosensitive channel
MFWHRAITAAVVVLIAGVLARLADHALERHDLDPASATRYRVLRRSILSSIVAVGVLSALLVIPAVRAVAGGILASGAVLGIVVGFAAQSTLSNFVAGLMIAFTQPLRLGDTLLTADGRGAVEEIGLVYTKIVLDDGSRLIVPNSKLASDTIRNASIGTSDRVAEITVQLALATDLEQALEHLRAAVPAERRPDVFVSALAERATVTVRAHAAPGQPTEELARELRLSAHGALRASGVFA